MKKITIDRCFNLDHFADRFLFIPSPPKKEWVADREMLIAKTREKALKDVQVMKVTLLCRSCSKEVSLTYPKNIIVDYTHHNHINNHGWVKDNAIFGHGCDLYEYKCNNCGSFELDIIKRESI